MKAERLQKVIAHAGVASRRAAEGLILAGRVRVNGKIVTELGVKVQRRDKVEVDGRRIVHEDYVYYVLHKPKAYISTLSDPEDRDHLGDLMRKVPERVYPVGRLDYHTSGVILMTNDGELADALLRPKAAVPKIYVAKMKGNVGQEALETLRKGVELDDGYVTRPAEVFVERSEDRHTWVNITIKEGKNRQIHRMGQGVGHLVGRLARISFAGITADGLRPGEFRQMNARELEKLKKKYVHPYKRAKENEQQRAGLVMNLE